MYIFITHTPNLGSTVAKLVREREQSREQAAFITYMYPRDEARESLIM